MRHDTDDVEPMVVGDRPVSGRRPGRGRHARPSRVGALVAALLASSAVLAIGVQGINTLVRPGDPAAADPGAAVLTEAERAAADRASRDFARPDPSISQTPSAAASAAAAPVPAAEAALRAARPAPVAGLNQAQMDHAVTIVEVAKRMGMPKRASVIAIVTALQETRLRNLANSRIPQSLNVPHEGVGSNFDSVGVFQQRPSQGWGTAAELMDPAIAADRFFARLNKVSGWQNMSIGAAAQAVQRSAFPGAYDQHQAQAQKIADAIF